MLKVRRKFGKYRIERRIAEGGFATVYQALDTIEGIRVALKVPHTYLMTQGILDDFRHEVRLTARLDHERILPLKNANFIDEVFVVVSRLGEQSLAERMQSRMALRTALGFAEQMLEAVAHAHLHGIIHCDIKPDNLIIFPGNRLRLADFGIAKVAQRTVKASGSGTMGYMAPEQAMGKPSFRSDVFSMGLVLYRMLSGHLPEWPYAWPPSGFDKLKRRVHRDLISVIRRAMEPDPRKRFADGARMLAAFRRAKTKALARPTARSRARKQLATSPDWQAVRWRQFRRRYGAALEARFKCRRCGGPLAECMRACPWCGRGRAVHREETRFPVRCTRCGRGMKLDWQYCPWCYGRGFEPHSRREYSDVRYRRVCANRSCSRKLLLPFMRYCPWCQRKVRRKWKVPGSRDACAACGWGVLTTFWSYCPWCGKPIRKR